jgi:hypothetical protein
MTPKRYLTLWLLVIELLYAGVLWQIATGR